MNVAGELTSVLSLQYDMCLCVCLTCKQNKAAEDMFKHLQITANQPRHEVSSPVNLQNRRFIIMFFQYRLISKQCVKNTKKTEV